MTPIHLPEVPDERAALAPYNFVPLPERVVPAEQQAPLDQSRYHPDRFTGRIECTLTTESPLFVRCGLTPEQLAEGLDAKDRPDFFYTASADTPVIPGSSLRGMLRALVEIAAYGKVDRVTDRPRFFYRAVAAKGDDPLAAPYRSQLRSVKAGYIAHSGDGWAIVPARLIGADSYIKVREVDVPPSVGLIKMNDPRYHLQRMPVSFTHKRTPKGRTVVDRIDRPGVHQYAGLLVTSGNMLETGRGSQRTPRKNHVVIPEPGSGLLPIDPQAAEDYRNGLSPFIEEQLGPNGVLSEGAPVFYFEPGRGEAVAAFGHSPNFRLPFRFPGSTRAASPRDFVPEQLRDDRVDLAEAIFGFVRGSRKARQEEQAVAGRIFVCDATPAPGQGNLWLSERPFTPHILGSPKPTTFQHYLVQQREGKRELKHYGSKPDEDTAVRGHKLYWHKGADPGLAMPPEKLQKASDTQLTTMRPVRAGVRFSFAIHVENLSQIELGALLWVLRLGADPAYRLKLGMGKPLGMGAVRVEYELYASLRAERYRKLFDDGWASGERRLDPAVEDAALAAFEEYVLAESGEQKHYSSLRETLRMRCLLALLGWPGPLPESTRYLEIERPVSAGFIPAARVVRPNDPTVNEYKERPVLPLPTQVAGVELSEAERATRPASGDHATAHMPSRQPTVQPPPPPKADPKIPAVGEVFRGRITQMDASLAVIEVEGFTEAQAVALLSADVADLRRYKVGNVARVEVTELKTQRSGRVLVLVKPAPRPKDGEA